MRAIGPVRQGAAPPPSPTGRDRPPHVAAARLARTRLERGLRLTVPEATALIAATVVEAARDGLHLAEALDRGRDAVCPGDALPGVTGAVTDIRVEVVLGDGTRLAVIGTPFGEGERGVREAESDRNFKTHASALD
ncbi:urease subunit gamma [Streptomyces sp. NPDC059695]|uniref:urease subunit gamma n=1 Tax=Streptomyces sp. NPDC059695 TaxID=3346910 RepID=UPI0036BF4D8A